MTVPYQNFTHPFFTDKILAAGDTDIKWASGEGTSTKYTSADTEKVEIANIRVSAAFNAASSGEVIVHVRKNSDTNLNTKTISISAPGSADAQVKEFTIYGPFSNLDIGVQSDDDTHPVTVSVSIYDGLKMTGVTAA